MMWTLVLIVLFQGTPVDALPMNGRTFDDPQMCESARLHSQTAYDMAGQEVLIQCVKGFSI